MPSYSVVTFGCQMNQHDSERMAEVLDVAGYVKAGTPEQADLIVLNTCSVREKAEQKLRSEVGRLALLKKLRPELIIGVAGCVAQQDGERLLKKMPSLDLVIGPDNIAELPNLLSELERGALPQVRTEFDLTEPRFLAAYPEAGKQSTTAFVTTMKGCDERCTFCIVPTTRGPERYRPSREIIDEITRMVKAGAREVTLLGQTVDSYRDPLAALAEAPGKGEDGDLGQVRKVDGDESEFPALLRAIAAEVPGLLRLRYTSPHPRHLTAALVLAHRDLAILPHHVHMPVQSGSDRVLKRMARRYTVAEYIERTRRLMAAVPGLTLSTDMIVGFPGETREDFELTLSLVRELGFVGIYGFKYSPRPFTPALKLGDDVSEDEKKARLAELLDLSEVIRQRHLETLVGGVERVLVEGKGRDEEAYTGRTNRNEIVHFGSSSDPTGEIVEVRIERAFKHSLGGTLVDSQRALPLRAKNEAPVKTRRALPLVIQHES